MNDSSETPTSSLLAIYSECLVKAKEKESVSALVRGRSAVTAGSTSEPQGHGDLKACPATLSCPVQCLEAAVCGRGNLAKPVPCQMQRKDSAGAWWRNVQHVCRKQLTQHIRRLNPRNGQHAHPECISQVKLHCSGINFVWKNPVRHNRIHQRQKYSKT